MNAFAFTPTSHLVLALAAGLAHSVWQGFTIAAILAIMLFWLRRGRSQTRYVLGCLALIAMVGCFAGTVALALARGGASTPAALSLSGLPEHRTISSSRTMDAVPPAQSTAIPANHRSDFHTLPAQSGFSARLPSVCVVLWLGGMLALSLRTLGGWWRIVQIRRRADPAVPEALRASLRVLSRRLELRSEVTTLLSEEVQVPSVLGWPRAVLLVPAGLVLSLPPRQLEAILAHELAHVRRWDFPVNLLQTLIETVLFYHPAVWWISEQVRVEREHCCDDLAVECVQDPLLYARALTALEELRSQPLIPALGAADGPLLRRVRRIVGQAPACIAVRWSPAHAATSMVLAVLLIALHGRAEAVSSPEPTSSPGPWVTPASVPARKVKRSAAPRPAPTVHKSGAAPRRPARKPVTRTAAPAPAPRRPPSRLSALPATSPATPPVAPRPASEAPRSFSGLVLDTLSGRRLSQVEVAVLDRNGGLLAEAATDAEGQFRLSLSQKAAEIVVLGRVRTSRQRYRTEYTWPVPIRKNAFPLAFSIRPERLVWDLPWPVDPAWTIIPTAVISGRLVDEQTGAPVAGRDLIAYRGHQGAEHARTDVEGRFSFRVLPGANRVAVMRDTVWVEQDGVRLKGLNAASVFNNLKVSTGQRLEVVFEVNSEHFKAADWEIKEAEFLRHRLREKEGQMEGQKGDPKEPLPQ